MFRKTNLPTPFRSLPAAPLNFRARNGEETRTTLQSTLNPSELPLALSNLFLFLRNHPDLRKAPSFWMKARCWQFRISQASRRAALRRSASHWVSRCKCRVPGLPSSRTRLPAAAFTPAAEYGFDLLNRFAAAFRECRISEEV